MKRQSGGLSKTSFFLKTRPMTSRYGLAALVSILAFLISDVLSPLLQSPVFVLPLFAVIISALYGGGGPGLLAALLSGVSFVYYFMPLTFSPSAHSTSDLIRLGLFVIFSLLISWISASFLSAKRRAERAHLEAEKANRYKSRLIAIVSHDLRTPLNAIIGYTQLLQDGTYGFLAKEQKTALERVHRNAGDLVRIVNDILDLSKIESGKMSVAEAPVEVPLLIKEALSQIGPLSGQKGVALECRFPEKLPLIKSDGMKIKRIVVNLLSNAIKFTEKGKITIIVNDQGVKNGIAITIKDTGVGIKPEALPKIFEAFYQVDGTEAPQGSGLGLAIVKDLTHLLNGEIEVDSEYGKGSAFTLFLPYWIP